MRRSILLLALLAAACSGLSREDRIRDRLERAGIKPRLAACMAPKLARDLSNDELAGLAAAAKGLRDEEGRVKIEALAGRLEGTDPHVADVAGRAAIGCAILG